LPQPEPGYFAAVATPYTNCPQPKPTGKVSLVAEQVPTCQPANLPTCHFTSAPKKLLITAFSTAHCPIALLGQRRKKDGSEARQIGSKTDRKQDRSEARRIGSKTDRKQDGSKARCIGSKMHCPLALLGDKARQRHSSTWRLSKTKTKTQARRIESKTHRKQKASLSKEQGLMLLLCIQGPCRCLGERRRIGFSPELPRDSWCMRFMVHALDGACNPGGSGIRSIVFLCRNQKKMI